MADTPAQYKSALTAQQVDAALTKLAGNDIADFITKSDLLQLVYPVGSIYISTNNVSPQTFLGGTWTQIQDRFLLAASSSYAAGSTGGEAAHKLTQKELPNYSLTVTNGDDLVHSKNGSTAAAYVQTQSSGWGIPNWEAKTVTVASGGSGQSHNNMPPYLAVYMWKRTK